MRKTLLFLGATLILSACGGEDGLDVEAKYPTGEERTGGDQNAIYEKQGSIFGDGGLSGLGKKRDNSGEGITVNSYLWRASLDTVSFMPLTSVDPFGGVILTDWYSAPETPNERIKLNVFIIGKQLKSDGIRVRVFKQMKRGSTWRDVDVSTGTATDLEDAILTRARQIRVQEKA